MSMSQPDDPKRGCSLPPGCKDLIDAIRLQKEEVRVPLPPITGRISLPEKVAVRYLAELLGRDMHSFVAELHELGICVCWHRSMNFSDAQKILRRHGILADKTP